MDMCECDFARALPLALCLSRPIISERGESASDSDHDTDDEDDSPSTKRVKADGDPRHLSVIRR